MLAGRPSQFIGNIASTTENKGPKNSFQYFRFRNASAGLTTNLVLVGNVAHQDTAGGKSSVWAVFVANSGTMKVHLSRNLADGPGPYTVPAGVQVWDDPDALTSGHGDLLAAAAGGALVRVPAGADGTYLRADSTAAGGLSYASPAEQTAASFAPGQDADTYSDYGNRNGSRVEVMSRRQTTAAAGAPTLDSGDAYLTYFTPDLDLEASTIEAFAGDTSQTGANLVRYGLYAVDDTGALACVARTDNDPDLCTGDKSSAAVADDGTGSSISGVQLQRGQRYAFAVLVVGAADQPTMIGRLSPAKLTALSPRSAGVVHDQSDLAPNYDAADVDDTAARADWGFAPEYDFERAFREYLIPSIGNAYGRP